MNIIIPQLYCPFESQINVHLLQAVNHTNDWVKTFGLHNKDYEKYIFDNFGAMTSRFYPDADQERLRLANDLNTLLFVLDDSMDNSDDSEIIALASTRQRFVEFSDTCLLILKSPEMFQGLANGPLAALKDVWLRLKSISSIEWQSNFIESISLMLEAGLWEFDNVHNGKLPTIMEFRAMRQFLGAAHISTDLVPVIQDITIPQSILQHPSIMEITILARNCVCWANDLFSLSKELAHGDRHNLVTIISNEKGIVIQEAIQEAALIHDSDMALFFKLSEQLPHFGNFDVSVKRFVRSLSNILKGNIDWSSQETTRYAFTFSQM